MRVLKSWTEHFRKADDRWLLLHKRGDYQYRNPDSVYIHRFAHFRSEQAARDYLEKHIARAEQPEWELFQRV